MMLWSEFGAEELEHFAMLHEQLADLHFKIARLASNPDYHADLAERLKIEAENIRQRAAA